MSEHETIEPMLAEHAFGTLRADDAARVEAHLATCAACRAELDELVDAVAQVEIAASTAVTDVPEASPRALLDAVRGVPQVAVPGAGAPVRRRGRRRRLVLGLGGASLAAAACTALVATSVALDRRDARIESLERRLRDARGDQVPTFRGASVKQLDTAGPFGDARAEVVLKKDAGVVAFNRVPAPPEGMVWQVWLVDASERITSIGIIDSARKAAFLPIPDVDPDDVERFIVTVEPAGGSEGPSAEEVATGTV